MFVVRRTEKSAPAAVLSIRGGDLQALAHVSDTANRFFPNVSVPQPGMAWHSRGGHRFFRQFSSIVANGTRIDGRKTVWISQLGSFLAIAPF